MLGAVSHLTIDLSTHSLTTYILNRQKDINRGYGFINHNLWQPLGGHKW